jgi:hypothetical protein
MYILKRAMLLELFKQAFKKKKFVWEVEQKSASERAQPILEREYTLNR